MATRTASRVAPRQLRGAGTGPASRSAGRAPGRAASSDRARLKARPHQSRKLLSGRRPMVGATSDKTRVPVTFPPVLSQDNTSVPVCRDTVRLAHLLLTSAITTPESHGPRQLPFSYPAGPGDHLYRRGHSGTRPDHCASWIIRRSLGVTWHEGMDGIQETRVQEVTPCYLTKDISPGESTNG